MKKILSLSSKVIFTVLNTYKIFKKTDSFPQPLIIFHIQIE